MSTAALTAIDWRSAPENMEREIVSKEIIRIGAPTNDQDLEYLRSFKDKHFISPQGIIEPLFIEINSARSSNK
jgi:hypothetical protein